MNEESELQKKLAGIEERLGELYRERAPILQRLAELRGAYELPPPSRRTETQRMVARCPRCGGSAEQ